MTDPLTPETALDLAPIKCDREAYRLGFSAGCLEDHLDRLIAEVERLRAALASTPQEQNDVRYLRIQNAFVKHLEQCPQIHDVVRELAGAASSPPPTTLPLKCTMTGKDCDNAACMQIGRCLAVRPTPPPTTEPLPEPIIRRRHVSIINNAVFYTIEGHDETVAFSTRNDAMKAWELIGRVERLLRTRATSAPGEPK